MSCLLYNLAIEPLIEKIQNSPLKGFNVNEKLSRVLVKVYADNTTIFLSKEDDPKELQKCLDLFCQAATAQFNEKKTEIIPVGPVDSQTELIRTQKFNDWKISDEVHIAQEGEAV
jgi:hypothetical protein